MFSIYDWYQHQHTSLLHWPLHPGMQACHLICGLKVIVVKALLEKGADVHAEDNDGYIPLHWAYEDGHHDIAAMLRAKGAVE